MDLNTTYLGFKLPHPIVPGASPLTSELDTVKQLEDAGAPLIQVHSLFEEEINQERVAVDQIDQLTTDSMAEALSFVPNPERLTFGPEEYLDRLRRIKESVGVPVMASLNGATAGGWVNYARRIEQAGADGLELNLYRVATAFDLSGSDLEAEDIAIVSQISREISIPLSVKLSPFYTSAPSVAAALAEAGARGLVLFNRFYQPDIDVEELEPHRMLQLSDSRELNLRLRWLAVLSGRVGLDLAATGGVHTAVDAVKAIMCGAHVCQVVSALLMRGPGYLATLVQELSDWLDEHEYDSLAQAFASMNMEKCPDPHVYERANYLHLLRNWRE